MAKSQKVGRRSTAEKIELLSILPAGILPNTVEIAFLQIDGDLSPEEFDLAMEYNFKAAKEIHEIMVDALKARYEGGEN